MDASEFLKKYATLISVVYIISVIFFSNSFLTLSPLEMGIARNNIASNIDKTRVYTAGRYFMGLGKEFIIYPTTVQQLDLPGIYAPTLDRQTVKIDIKLQYKLAPANLVNLYLKRNMAYGTFYRNVVTQTAKEICKEFETIPDFYTKRVEISQAIEDKVREQLEAEYAELVAFQVSERWKQATTDGSTHARRQANACTQGKRTQARRASERRHAGQANAWTHGRVDARMDARMQASETAFLCSHTPPPSLSTHACASHVTNPVHRYAGLSCRQPRRTRSSRRSWPNRKRSPRASTR